VMKDPVIGKGNVRYPRPSLKTVLVSTRRSLQCRLFRHPGRLQAAPVESDPITNRARAPRLPGAPLLEATRTMATR
jgi:hypothetical protein